MTLRSDSVFRGAPLGCVGSCSLLVLRPANPGRMLSPASVVLSGCTAARLAPAVPRRDAKLRWSAQPAPRPMTSCRFAAFPGGYEKPGQIVPLTQSVRGCFRIRPRDVVLTVGPHSDVSSHGDNRASNCGNIPRSAGQSKRVHSWCHEICQSARSSDRLTMPDLSSQHRPRWVLMLIFCEALSDCNHHKAHMRVPWW